MKLSDILDNIPKGKFRVFGRDNFEDEFFLIGDYDAGDEAIAVAQENEAEERNTNPEAGEIATTFYVINCKLNFLYGIPKAIWRIK